MNASMPYENVTSLTNASNNVSPASSWSTENWYWRVALYGIGGACIAMAGIVCNVVSVVVLVHFKKSSSAPFLLICLAVFDSIYLLSNLTLECLPLMENGKVINWGYRDFLYPIYCALFPLPLVSQTWVTYLVVVITIERFLVVAWPFLAYRLCSIKSAAFAVAFIVLFSTLYHIPVYIAFSPGTKWSNRTNKWIPTFVKNAYGESDIYSRVYEKWVMVSVNFALPFAILLVFNVLMIRFLRKSKADVSIKRTFSRDEQRLTLMVFCMTLIFFVCELLAAMSKIVLASYSSYHDPPIEANRFSATADTIMLVNSAVNFAIYCVTGKKFRQTFVQIFCGCRKEPKSKTAFVVQGEHKTKVANSRSRISSLSSSCSKSSVPRRSTTDSSLSSYSNCTRSSKLAPSCDSIHNKLIIMNSG